MTAFLNHSHLVLLPPLPEKIDPIVLAIILLVAAGALGFSLLWRKRQKTVLRRDLRLYWGLPRTPSDEKEFEKIGLYYRLKTRDSADGLDDKTWADLNFDQVFEFIDRTSSRVGQQYLYDLLRTPKLKEEPLLKLERVVNRLKDEKLREGLQVELHRLNHKDAWFIPYLFQDEFPRLPVPRFVLLLLTLATVASLVGAFFSSGLRSIFIFLVIVNAVLEYLNRDDNIVMVATHDIELADLLGHHYESHHFREIISHQQMDFDYRIQPGTSSTRNAIAILDLLRYPKPVIGEALNVVNQLVQKKSQTR